MGLYWGWFRRVRVGRRSRRQASEHPHWSLPIGCTGRTLLVIGCKSLVRNVMHLFACPFLPDEAVVGREDQSNLNKGRLPGFKQKMNNFGFGLEGH
jgi:hypothetical protein